MVNDKTSHDERVSRGKPQSPEAERGMLALMMMQENEPGEIDEIARYMEPEDFYVPSNRAIYSAIRSLRQDGKACDPVTVADEMMKSDVMADKAQAMENLTNICSFVPQGTSWRQYADILKLNTLQRKVANAGERIAAMAYSSPESCSELVTETRTALDYATRSCPGKSPQALEELRARLAVASDDESGGDSMLKSLLPGEVTLIGGLLNAGKTSMAVQMALNASKAGNPVVFFAFQHTGMRVVERAVSNLSGIPTERIHDADLNEDQRSKAFGALQELESLPFDICEELGLDAYELEVIASRSLCGRRGVVFVDSLDCLQVDSSRSSEGELWLCSAVRTLKAVARQLGCHVVAVSKECLAAGVCRMAENHMEICDDTSGDRGSRILKVAERDAGGRTNTFRLDFSPETGRFSVS